MKLESIKELKRSAKTNDFQIDIAFDSFTKIFDDKNRYLILNSKLDYVSKDFKYSGVIPTVKIPYNDPSLGFLINGTVSASVGIYQRAPGVELGVEKKDTSSATIYLPKVDIISTYNARMTICYHSNMIVIVISRNNKETKIPIAVFLKAISELPYSVIMSKFAVRPQELLNSFVSDVKSGKMFKSPIYENEGDEEPSVEDCIDVVYRAINNFGNKFATNYSVQWKLERILNYLNMTKFKSVDNYESTLSLGSRAKGLAQYPQSIDIFVKEIDGNLKKSKFTVSDYIDETVAEEIKKYDISSLAIERDGKSLLIQEDTSMLFRAKGYLLASDLPSLDLTSGTLIDDNVLKTLNNSKYEYLEVVTPLGRKVLYRSEMVTIGDFVTIVNILITSDVDTAQSITCYDLASRVIINYDKQVLLEVEHAYNDIISVLGSTTLKQVIENLPWLPYDNLTHLIKNHERKENVQSEITNVLSAAIAAGKASALLPETPKNMTYIQKGQYGRLDSLHAPESDKIGSVQQKTVLAEISSKTGEILTPYEIIEDGIPTGRIEMVSASQELGKYIVEWDNDLSDEVVIARIDGDLTTVNRKQVSYKDTSVFQDMSVSRAVVPFPEFSQPKRALMAAKMGGQAVPLLFPERALVSTGADTEVPCLYYTARQIIESANIEIKGNEQLKIIEMIQGKIVTYKLIYNNILFDFTAPNTPTSKNTLYGYYLNHKPDYLYDLDDIVLYSHTCDINHYDFWVREDQGLLPYVKDYTKPALANGVNLLVGYKTFQSSTIDDAVVISDRLVRNKILSNLQLYPYEYELKPTETLIDSSIPELNTYVYAGDDIITFYREKNNIKKTFSKKVKQSGFVAFIDRKERNNKITVWVATIHDAVTGDKVAGRYGNKSVIAKIVPHYLMPYDPETGQTLDIICNPLGIPSRMNLGQVLEVTLGAVMMENIQIACVSPFYKNIKQEIIKEYKNLGLKPKRLFLPEYGKYSERPVMVGCQYFMKLEQMSNLKWSAVGYPTSVDAVFGQPVKSLNTKKGQSIAEMETWALLASGAKKQLQNYFTISADDSVSRTSYFEMLQHNSDEGIWDDSLEDIVTHDKYNISMCVTQTIFRTAGLDIEVGKDNRYHISVLNHNDITKVIDINALKSRREVVSAREWCKIPLKAKSINPFWIYNFPLQKLLGVSLQPLINKTKYLNIYTHEVIPASSISELNANQYLTGVNAVIHLLETTTLDEVIAKLRGVTSDKQEVIISGSSDEDLEQLDISTNELLSFCYKLKKSGNDLTALIMTYLPVIPAVFRQTESGSKDKENAFQEHMVRIAESSNADDIYHNIRKFIGFGQDTLKDTNIRRYFFGRGAANNDHGRLREKVMSKRVGFSGRTLIIPMEDASISPVFVGLPWIVILTEMSRIFAIRLFKQRDKIEAELDIGGDMILLSNFHHLDQQDFEDLILTLHHFSPYAMRKILGGSDSFLYSLFITLRKYIEHIINGNVDDRGRILYNGKWEYPELLPDDTVVDAMVVSFGRQPTLHRRSLRTYFVVPVEGYSTHIHPLVCKGYNADFDGDQMWNAQIFGEAKIESFKTTSIVQDLISEKDGSYALDIAQDVALGIYCATTYKDNASTFAESNQKKDVYTYNSLTKLDMDLTYGELHYYDIVLFEDVDGYCYLSTAGRIYLNALVHGFTKKKFTDKCGIFKYMFGDIEIPSYLCDLKYDCIWNITSIKTEGREDTVQISNIQLEVYRDFGARESVEVTQKLYELGMKASDIYSVSMNIEDLEVDADITPLVENSKAAVEDINSLYQMGLLTIEERRKSTNITWDNTKKIAQKEIIGAMKPNSNMYYMLYSGARGKPDQMMQTAGFIGNISKTENSDIEYPILRGYGTGLTSFDAMQTCYSARIGVISTQSGTKDTGYATRQSTYMKSGLIVQEEDCGIVTNEFNIEYIFDLNDDLVEKILGDFVVEIPSDADSIKPVLSRTGFMVTEQVVDFIKNNLINGLILRDYGKLDIPSKISPSYKSQLLNKYSYALPYLGEQGKLTEKTVEWIERHLITSVPVDDFPIEDTYLDTTSVAYLPVHYSDTRHYIVEDTMTEIDEELLLAKSVSDESPNFYMYKRILSQDNKLNIKTLQYIAANKIRVLKFTDGIVINIKYELSKLFSKLTIGRIAYGLPHLDADKTVTERTLEEIENLQLENVAIRTTLTCVSENGCCSKCYGKNIYSNKMIDVDAAVGITAAQTMCEPLNQATLNVQHGGGKRTGLSSGLEYYTKMLKGMLVTQRTQNQLEQYAPVSGFVMQNKINPMYIQIVDENDNELYATLQDPSRLSVPTGSYINKGDILFTGLTNFNRYRSTIIPGSALKTRMLLIQEYDKVFNSLGVSPKNYEILSRAQTSQCYLVSPSSSSKIKDTGKECKNPTGNYELRVSTQAETVRKFTGIGSVAFERAYETLGYLAVDNEGLPLGSALGNIVTGTDVTSSIATCIPKRTKSGALGEQSTTDQLESILLDSRNHKTVNLNDYDLDIQPIAINSKSSVEMLMGILDNDASLLESGELKEDKKQATASLLAMDLNNTTSTLLDNIESDRLLSASSEVQVEDNAESDMISNMNIMTDNYDTEDDFTESQIIEYIETSSDDILIGEVINAEDSSDKSDNPIDDLNNMSLF